MAHATILNALKLAIAQGDVVELQRLSKCAHACWDKWRRVALYDTLLRPETSFENRILILHACGALIYALSSASLYQHIVNAMEPDFFIKADAFARIKYSHYERSSDCWKGTDVRLISRLIKCGIKLLPEQMDVWWYQLPHESRWDIVRDQMVHDMRVGRNAIAEALDDGNFSEAHKLYSIIPLAKRWEMRREAGSCRTNMEFLISANVAPYWAFYDALCKFETHHIGLASCLFRVPHVTMGWTTYNRGGRKLAIETGDMRIPLTASDYDYFEEAKIRCRRDQMYALLLLVADEYLVVQHTRLAVVGDCELKEALNTHNQASSNAIYRKSTDGSFQRLVRIWKALTFDGQMMLLRAFGPVLPRPLGATNVYLPMPALVWAYLDGD